MTTQFLPIIHDNAHLSLVNNLPLVEGGKVSQWELNIYCQEYRIKAICSMLMTSDLLSFFTSLTKSGLCCLGGLKKLPYENRVTSKFTPFFDAVAARDFETAKQISNLSTDKFDPDKEYEEDFLYMKLVMGLLDTPQDKKRIEDYLNAYKALNPSELRFQVCLALFERGCDVFNDTLQELIVEYEDGARAGLDNGVMSEDLYFTEGQIFIEGIALLVIAERLGMKIENQFKYIPPMIRKGNSKLPLKVDWRFP